VGHNDRTCSVSDNIGKYLPRVRFGSIDQSLGDGSEGNNIMGTIQADADEVFLFLEGEVSDQRVGILRRLNAWCGAFRLPSDQFQCCVYAPGLIYGNAGYLFDLVGRECCSVFSILFAYGGCQMQDGLSADFLVKQ